MTVSTLPCPKCNSSDAWKVYPDGGAKCYSCGHTQGDYEFQKKRKGDTQVNTGKVTQIKESSAPKFIVEGVETREIKNRHLSENTCAKWKYQVGKGYHPKTKQIEPCHIANYFDERHNLVGQKLRFADKAMTIIGKLPPLYGKWLWQEGFKTKDGSAGKIVVTEGEIDALSVSEAQNNKYPVVSISNGAQAAKHSIQKELEWLRDSFDEVILMFDNDEHGEQAAKECSKLFPPGQCKIATLTEKDPNEMLVKGKVNEIINAKFNAKPYRPDGIVRTVDLLELIDKKPEWGTDLPWQPLTDWTYGLKDGQLTVVLSGSGMGKTELLKSIIANILNTKPKERIGIVFLEEEAKDTVVKIAGKLVNKRFDSPEYVFDEKERNDTIKRLADNDAIDYFDHYGCNDYESVRDVIRSMVVSGGCKYIFLDHLTAFTDGKPDANAIMEKAMNELASMTRELKFNLHCVSHIRKSDGSRLSAEAGGEIGIDDAKGSGAIKQWANVVYAMERNTQHEEENVRNTSTVRMLKIREAGQNVGRTFKLKYIPITGELKLMEQEGE